MTDLAQTYRDEMTQLEAQLTPSDRAYFSDLRVYASARALWVSEIALNQALLSMMRDLLEAEAAGETAVQLFGDDPKAMADAVIGQLPRPRLRDTAALGLIVISLSWFFLLLSGGTATAAGMRLSMMAVVLTPLIEGGLIVAAFAVIRAATYPHSRWLATRYGAGLTIGTLVVVGLAALVAVYIGLPQVWSVLIPVPWNFVVIGGATLAFLIVEWRQHDRGNWPIMAIGGFLAGLALIEQAAAIRPLAIGAWCTWVVLGSLGVAVVLFVAWRHHQA
ncbi:hypothetical protein [Lacticaseibacillus absianus]|uniref:hypothetical protein n=1 Tax=Lacticaseibacillus absianus TaxID=2729623 RepID=UPI0015CB1A9E|nr:hypothetical protein [Lacticaseibacillus absianus]